MKKLIIAVITLLLFNSCTSSRKGYGCDGKTSWKQMIKRANKPY
jgi:hypothetical protein